jgi:hypothetical protein
MVVPKFDCLGLGEVSFKEVMICCPAWVLLRETVLLNSLL